jgi:3-methyladenine DNA glycosylase AlkD
MIEKIKKELEVKKDEKKAKLLQRFFKTGKGQYGEGDIFLGITVPKQREIAKKYSGLPLAKIKELLESKIHEYRMTGGLILVEKYNNSEKKGDIVDFYLKNSTKFNNWDLVDLTAPKILGNFLLKNKRDILYNLAKSKNIWNRRISIVATYSLIKENQLEEVLEISEQLLEDKHELINKAVGWMLREVGKKNKIVLENFLKKNCAKMPRVTLRYSIEKFSKEEQKKYLCKSIR